MSLQEIQILNIKKENNNFPFLKLQTYLQSAANFRIFLIAGFLGVFISGCQPAVRFASVKNSSGSNSSAATAGKYYKSPVNNNIETSEARLSLLSEAEGWLGSPYKYGGNTRSGVDCSGFVHQVYLQNGIRLPRTAAEQWQATQPVDDSERIPGDLLFFQKNGKINHVGIFIGGGEMIHASTSRGVIRQSLNDYTFNERYAGARRISTIP